MEVRDLVIPPKKRNAIYDLNQVIKNMYDCYISVDGFIFPPYAETVKRPAYTRSLVRHKFDEEFMQCTLLDIDSLSKALKGICMTQTHTDDNEFKLSNDKKKLCFSIGKFIDADAYVRMNEYLPRRMIMNDMKDIESGKNGWATKEIPEAVLCNLIDYKIEEFALAPKIHMVLTKELLPAIKKADKVLVHYRLMDGKFDIYEVILHSLTENWDVYTKHYIVSY